MSHPTGTSDEDRNRTLRYGSASFPAEPGAPESVERTEMASAEERNRLWQARHDAFWATLALRPGAKSIATDVCVPISRLAECNSAVKQDIAEAGLLAPLVGHVGDGNFHLIFLVDLDDQDEVARAKAVNGRMVEKALALGGTCTGEHGVGYGKIAYLEAEHGAVAVRAMRRIKEALDPDNILNPGKIVPLEHR